MLLAIHYYCVWTSRLREFTVVAWMNWDVFFHMKKAEWKSWCTTWKQLRCQVGGRGTRNLLVLLLTMGTGTLEQRMMRISCEKQNWQNSNDETMSSGDFKKCREKTPLFQLRQSNSLCFYSGFHSPFPLPPGNRSIGLLLIGIMPALLSWAVLSALSVIFVFLF